VDLGDLYFLAVCQISVINAHSQVKMLLAPLQIVLSYFLVSGHVYLESPSNCSILLLFNYKAEKQEVVVPNVAVVLYRAGAKQYGFQPRSDKAAKFIYSRQICVIALCYFGSRVPAADINQGRYRSSRWMAKALQLFTIRGVIQTQLSTSQTYRFIYAPKIEVVKFLKGERSALDAFDRFCTDFVFLYIEADRILEACTLMPTTPNMFRSVQVPSKIVEMTRCKKVSIVNTQIYRTMIYIRKKWFIHADVLRVREKPKCGTAATVSDLSPYEYALHEVISCKDNSTYGHSNAPVCRPKLSTLLSTQAAYF